MSPLRLYVKMLAVLIVAELLLFGVATGFAEGVPPSPFTLEVRVIDISEERSYITSIKKPDSQETTEISTLDCVELRVYNMNSKTVNKVKCRFSFRPLAEVYETVLLAPDGSIVPETEYTLEYDSETDQWILTFTFFSTTSASTSLDDGSDVGIEGEEGEVVDQATEETDVSSKQLIPLLNGYNLVITPIL